MAKLLTPTDAETRIRKAARQVFLRQGLAGARMQDIANAAGVDKALVHYYYRSKERLFALVFDEAIGAFVARLRDTLAAPGQPLTEKLRQLVQPSSPAPTEFAEFAEVARFVLHELSREPGGPAPHAAWAQVRELPVLFAQQVELAVAAGELRPVDSTQLLVTLLSLSLFPLLAQPLLQPLLGLDDAGFAALMSRRADELPTFMFRALAP